MSQSTDADAATGEAIRESGATTRADTDADQAARAAGDGSAAALDDVLTRLPSRPVHEHVGVFEAVHRGLQGRLADVEE